MSEEQLIDSDPFGDDVVDDIDYITEKMVKKATFLIHKLADQKKQDYKDIQKKCKSLFSYSNLAKVTLDQGHQIINKLIELTGGEEEEPALDPTVKDDLTVEKTAQEPKHEEKETVQEDDIVIRTMRESIRAAVSITLGEIVSKDVPVMGLGGVVLEVGKVIFEAKMKKEEAV